MKLWSDFYSRVMPYVLGCPNPTVDAALIDAARDFCTKTKCWKQTEPASVSPGFSRGYFDLPAGSEIVQIKRVTVNGKDYDIKDASDVPDDWEANPPDDCTLYHDTQSEYLLFPAPTSADAIVFTLILQPTYAGTGVDDETHALYAEAIAAGARAKLQRMPRQDWSDMAQAQIDGLFFNAQMHAAANREFMRAKSHRVTKAYP